MNASQLEVSVDTTSMLQCTCANYRESPTTNELIIGLAFIVFCFYALYVISKRYS